MAALVAIVLVLILLSIALGFVVPWLFILIPIALIVAVLAWMGLAMGRGVERTLADVHTEDHLGPGGPDDPARTGPGASDREAA